MFRSFMQPPAYAESHKSANVTQRDAFAALSALEGMTTAKAILLVADGTEEMEAVITVDILRRGGVQVTVCNAQEGAAGDTKNVGGSDLHPPVVCSRGVRLVPDTTLSQMCGGGDGSVALGDYDAVVLPGGMGGAKTFAKSDRVKQLIKAAAKANRIVAAICAAPIAVEAAGVFLGKRITSHPSVRNQITNHYNYCEDRVVEDGNLITSRGPGTALEFALALVNRLAGSEVLETIKEPLMMA